MKDPCEACINYTSRVEGHRRFTGCKQPELKEKGFHYDDFWYHHTCDYHTPKPECLKCEYYHKPYCSSVYADCIYEERNK